MSIIYSPKTRRQFLVGTGKSLLALPFLPSLIPSYAEAQAAVVPRRMMNFAFDHHNESQFWPNPSISTTAIGSIGVKERLFSSMGNSASTVVSSLLSNPLYNTLLANNQITIARGFEFLYSGGSGHCTRAFGGNSTLECGDTSEDPTHQSTFDYLVEKSLSVYPNAAGNVTKSIRIDLDGCWTYVQKVGSRSLNPGAYGYGDILNMYNTVFGSLTGSTVPTTDLTNTRKTNILNRVFPAFQSYKSNRKISSEDRLRLDQHMSFLSDLQKSVAIFAPSPQNLSCIKPSNSGISGANKLQINNLYVDLMVAAFKCGLTQFGSINFEAQDPSWLPNYVNGTGDGFHGLMHGAQGIALQNKAYETMHKFGYNLIADRFLTPLNVEEGSTGRTYADNMITTSLSHLGMQPGSQTGNHNGGDMQHVMFGSMGGKLRSGRYYTVPGAAQQYPYPGTALPNNTFMMTLLNLMGVPASEYNLSSSVTGKGYGYYNVINEPQTLGARIYSPVIEMLV